MKKLLALLTVAVLLLGVTGCSGGNRSADPTEPAGATLQVSLTHSCRAELLTDDPDFQDVNACQRGGKIVLNGWLDDGTTTLGLYDPSTGDTVKTSIPYDPGYGFEFLGFAYRDGRLTALTEHYERWDDEFKGYTWEYRVYDDDLNLLETRPFTAELDNMESILHGWRCLSDGTELFPTTAGVFLYDEKNGTQKISDDTMSTICLSPDETVWVVPNSGKPRRLDRDTLTLEPLELDDLPKSDWNGGGYSDGIGKYALLCHDANVLYGLDLTAGTKEELVNFTDSDIAEVSALSPLPDGRYIASSIDWLTFQYDLLLLTPRTQEEMDSIRTVTLAALTFYQDMESRIARFNRQSKDYRIVLKSYYDNSRTDQDYNRCLEEFHNDLLSGNVPDIMLISSDYQMLSNKGLFEDMRPWMENDPDFHEEDYMMNVLEAGSYKGHIERIPWSFFVDCFAGKSQYLGDKSNFTPDELTALDLPEGMGYLYDEHGRSNLFTTIQCQLTNHFVDYASGTCTFDSPEFVSLLELVNTLPDKGLQEDDYCCRDDRILLQRVDLSMPSSYHMNHQVVFENEDITLCSICSDGVICTSCGIAVSAQSKEKEAAWEFIKFNLQEEQQYFGDTQVQSGFPINRAALEQVFTDSMKPHDEHHTASIEMDGVNVEYDEVKPDEIDTLRRYLNGLTTAALDDTKINAIVNEEAGKYFSGDCTAQDAANAIQGRVSLYLSEQG